MSTLRPIAGLPRACLPSTLLLLIAEGESHGYDLLQSARRLGMYSAEPGGLYRTLRTMEHEALLESSWEPSTSGPARRIYRIGPGGQEALGEAMAELEGLRSLLDALLERYEVLKRPDIA